MWVGLFTTTPNFGTGESGGRATAFVLEVGNNTTVNDGTGRFGWGGFEIEKGFADFLAGKVEDGERGELGFNGERK